MSDYPYKPAGDRTAPEDRIVYVRRVDRADLPKDMRKQTKGMDEVYSIHDADGFVLALVDDRDKAFRVARLNERMPMSVH